MKAHLMFKRRDFDLKSEPAPHSKALTQDLELDVLFATMAGSDKFLLQAVRVACAEILEDPEAIRYRQEILAECLLHSAIVRSLYAVAVSGVEGALKVWRGTLNRYPDRVLYWSMELLRTFVKQLRRLREIADEHGNKFRSEGLATLLRMLAQELDDEYLATVEAHLRQLTFPDGISMSAELGEGNQGTKYTLRTSRSVFPSWTHRLMGLMERLPRRDRASYVVQIDERDESGANALAELKNRGIGAVASVLAQSADHIQSFFEMLRAELAFYVGCVNLAERLAALGEPICVPEVLDHGQPLWSASGLYDVALSLTTGAKVVANDVNADGKALIMITGANRGGKSTGLRSLGQAQVMMQWGMFVAAESYRSSPCASVFTHFRREEDAGMKNGKFDEELARMSDIVNRLKCQSLVLFNESFSSTNAREASIIASDIVGALLETRVRVVYVTHLFDLACEFYRRRPESSLFLRAERRSDGTRTYRLLEGAPLPTSHGEDLYRQIFVAASGEGAVEVAR
jgi:DNA mismatch repair ATPase MutS